MKNLIEKLPGEMIALIKLAGECAAKNNTRVYLVGGFVRDMDLGVENFDLDFVVEGDGIRFAETLAGCLGSGVVRHHAFRTATIRSQGHIKIDVSSARKEIYPRPGHLPQVSPGNIEDDLFRRDFTINAMAVDISSERFGCLIDIFRGSSDLKAKKIRVMHDLSFIDDPTRILRAVRFEKRFGFRIEKKTLELLKSAVACNMPGKVTPQRLHNELVLILKEREPVRALARVYELCGFDFIHKKLRFTKKEASLMARVKKESARFRRQFPHRRKLDLWLMYFMALVDGLSVQDIKDICARFGFAKGEETRMIDFRKLSPAFLKKLSGRTSRPSLVFSMLEPLPYEVILLVRAKYRDLTLQMHIDEFLKIYHGTRIHVTGADLQKLGCKPGPQYQAIFKKILRAKLEGKVTSKQDELTLACRIAKI